MNDSRSWSHMSARTTDGNYLKKLLKVRSEEGNRKEKEKNKLDSNCKGFWKRKKKSE